MARSDKYYTLMNTDYCYFRKCCPDFGTEKCNYQCRQLDGMKWLIDLSNLPKKYRFPQKLSSDLIPNEDTKRYVEYLIGSIDHFVKKGYNAYFYGDVGTGKTSWAVKALTTYFNNIASSIDHEVRGLYISVPSFLRDVKLSMTYRNEDFHELLETIKECDLIVWDDIMQTDPTAFESQWLYSYINERIADGRANIYTSNISPDELSKLDARLHSRICHLSDCIEFEGNDVRYYNKFMVDIYESENNSVDNSENCDDEENELNISDTT